jgi:hypothetical protein
MSIARFLQWLANTGLSVHLRGSTWAEPVVETLHVLTLTLFFGFAILLDLRLLGLQMTRRRDSDVIRELNPWLIGGFAIMIATGILLFGGDPVTFYASVFFKVKMVLLVVAGLNVLLFNVTAGRKVAEWDRDTDTPGRAKLAAILSLAVWVAIIAAGRAIAYSIPPP